LKDTPFMAISDTMIKPKRPVRCEWAAKGDFQSPYHGGRGKAFNIYRCP